MKHTNVLAKVLLLTLCFVLALSCLFGCNGEEIEALNNATETNAAEIEALKTLVDQVKTTADAAATAAALESVKTDLAGVKTTADAAATAAALETAKTELQALIADNGTADAATKTAIEASIAAVNTAIATLEAELEAADTALDNSITAVNNAVTAVNTALTTAKSELEAKIAAAEKAIADFKTEYASFVANTNTSIGNINDQINAINTTINNIKANLDTLNQADALAEYKAVTALLASDDAVYSYAAFKKIVASIDEDQYPKAHFQIFSQKAEETEFFLSRAVTVAQVKELIDSFNYYIENEFPTLYEVYVELLGTVVITPDGKSANGAPTYSQIDDVYGYLVASGYEMDSLVDGTNYTVEETKAIIDAAYANAIAANAAVKADVADVIAAIDDTILYITSYAGIEDAADAILAYKNAYFSNAEWNEYYVSRTENDAAQITKAYISNYNVYEAAVARYTILDNARNAFLAYDFCDVVDNYATVRPLWTDLEAVTTDYTWYTTWVADNEIEEENIVLICNSVNAELVDNINEAIAALATAQVAYDAAIAAQTTNAAAITAKEAEIAVKNAEIATATDDIVKAALEAELATLTGELATLNTEKTAIDETVGTTNAAVIAAKAALDAANAEEPTKPAITASADLYVVKAYNFADAMNDIYVDHKVDELNAATDAYYAKNVKNDQFFVYYSLYDEMFGEDALYDSYSALLTAIENVADATTAQNDNFMEMFNNGNDDRFDTFETIAEILYAYDDAKEAIIEVLTVGATGAPVGMIDALAATELNEIFGHRLNCDYYTSYETALNAIYTACQLQAITPDAWDYDIAKVDGKDANNLEDILALYTVGNITMVTEGDENYAAIIADIAETLTTEQNPEYILAALNARYNAYTKGIADVCATVMTALEKFNNNEMALADGWEFVANEVEGEWVIGTNTGYARKLGYIALQVGAGNIILEIEGVNANVSLFDLLDDYNDAIANYKEFAYNAEADSVAVNDAIVNAAATLAGAADLNNRAAIIAVWDTYMNWAKTYLANDIENVETNLDAHAAAIAALYDKNGAGIPAFGESYKFSFVTSANFETLYNAYNITNATLDAAKVVWADLKVKLENLDEATEWTIHNYGDLNMDGVKDDADDTTSFFAVFEQFNAYVATYYGVDIATESLNSYIKTINVVAAELEEDKAEWEVFQAFNKQRNECVKRVNAYMAQANNIIALINELAANTYLGTLDAEGNVVIESAEAASKALLSTTKVAEMQYYIANIETLLTTFRATYCDGECVGLDEAGKYTLMFEKAKAIVAAAEITVANAGNARYNDIVEHYYQLADQVIIITNVAGVDGAYNLYEMRVNAIVASTAP